MSADSVLHPRHSEYEVNMAADLFVAKRPAVIFVAIFERMYEYAATSVDFCSSLGLFLDFISLLGRKNTFPKKEKSYMARGTLYVHCTEDFIQTEHDEMDEVLWYGAGAE